MFYKKKYEDLKKEWDKQNQELDNMSTRFSKKLKLKDDEIESIKKNNAQIVIENKHLENEISQLQKQMDCKNVNFEIEKKEAYQKYINIVNKNRKNISKIANISKKNKKLEHDLEKSRQMIIALQEELSLEKKKFKPTATEIKEFYRNKRGTVK